MDMILSDTTLEPFSELEFDQMGEPRSIWKFCGCFPLAEISQGYRACRAGWRNRGFFSCHKDPDNALDMLSACLDGRVIVIERETPEYIDGSTFDPLDIDDMMACDWYLEIGSLL